MSLEQFMPGRRIRCSNCDKLIDGSVRKLKNEKTGEEKPYCRECYYKKLRKPFDAKHYTHSSGNFKLVDKDKEEEEYE